MGRGERNALLPFQAMRERHRSVLDVQHAAMDRRFGRRGGVEQQGTHQERAATRDDADDFRDCVAQLLNAGGVEFAMTMRTRQHPKRAVRGVTVVQACE